MDLDALPIYPLKNPQMSWNCPFKYQLTMLSTSTGSEGINYNFGYFDIWSEFDLHTHACIVQDKLSTTIMRWRNDHLFREISIEMGREGRCSRHGRVQIHCSIHCKNLSHTLRSLRNVPLNKRKIHLYVSFQKQNLYRLCIQ